MNVVCAPLEGAFNPGGADLEIVLYAHADRPARGAAGANIIPVIKKAGLSPAPRAWDLLSIALSVIAADAGIRRNESPDGWTREIGLHIALADPVFWSGQRALLEAQLRFLTTDRWTVAFSDGGVLPAPPRKGVQPDEDSVSLLSGGLDSLIGAIDLVTRDAKHPCVVSQISRGDREKQTLFARRVGGGMRHLQLNHVANVPGEKDRSQRARSFIFLAYGVLLASALGRYQDGDTIPLYVCENGFIAINPPLTTGRLGSLSTRTAHPLFLGMFQRLLDGAGLRVRLENPYQFNTKGEMLTCCADQDLLKAHAHISTSCGRYMRYGYRHCGRCVPCLIRRASFHAWGQPDRTHYVYADLSRDQPDYARFDDVRSAAMALAEVRADGLGRWLGTSVSATLMGDTAPYRDVVARGLEEVGRFLDAAGVT